MNEDAIDRKLVCAFIDGLISDDGEREKGLEYIRSMPPVNPTKTGHWIDIDGGVECDKCGKWYPHAPIAKNEIKFCSECGAKMVEPQERSDKE